MSERTKISRAVEASGVVAIVRVEDPTTVRPIVDGLLEGGITCLELTLSIPGAIDLISEITRGLPEQVCLGAGTVCDLKDAKRVVKAGAKFVVSPILDLDIVKYCREKDVACMPGCFTPTEIFTGWQAGASIIKVFPATSLGPGFFKDVRGPLPDIKLMPTGGVRAENVGDWFKAGAVAVGIGGSLIDSKAIAAGDYRHVSERARDFVAEVAKARQN